MPSPSAISVNALGIGMHHPAGFVVNRPRGSGDFLFLHFLTTYRIRLKDRIHLNEAGDCIIYSPNTRQEYGSDGIISFGNDWIHMSGDALRPLLKELDLPVNELFTPRTAAFIPSMLREIRLELANHGLHWEFDVSLKVQKFLLELSRAVNGGHVVRLAPRNEEMHERLNRLRLVMQERCAEKWDLRRMAGQVHMSRSAFMTIYRNVFNRSPVNDLIDMRLNLAKRYLDESDKTVTEIAYICGFSDIYYFCRQFKAKTGQSPGAYRRENRGATRDGGGP